MRVAERLGDLHRLRGNERLFDGPADWISPGFEDKVFDDCWYSDPPLNEGRKVVLTDTDHYAPGGGDALWAWRSFMRGHNPILMDYGIIDVVRPLDPTLGVPSYESLEAARYAMGDTRRLAERIGLIGMRPRGDLSSTGYALANAGSEYVVLQPDGMAGAFTVTLAPGVYVAEWFGVDRRETLAGGEVAVERLDALTFRPPSGAPGPAVLYLRRV